MRPFTDAAYPLRTPPGLPVLPRVTVPAMSVRRRPRRDNADVAWADQALRITGRVAGPVAVGVIVFLLALPWVVPERASAVERVAVAQVMR